MSKLTNHVRVPAAWVLVTRAYLLLVHFDCYLASGNLGGLLKCVRAYPRNRKQPDDSAIERTISAMDMACVWYWKEVLCLQRAAAITCLMRKHGFNAELILGAQRMPFAAHAWVEVDHGVVGERSRVPAGFAILDRC